MLKRIVLATIFFFFTHIVSAEWFSNSFEVMGTQAHVEFWLDDTEDKNTSKHMTFLVQEEMHRIDQAMSPYKQTSELSLVNNKASAEPVVITNELFELLTESYKIAEMSDGAFDITYASVGYQYDYRGKQRPDQTSIESALKAIDYHAVILDEKNSTVRFSQPDVKIDLGGIAKGYAVKRCLELLKTAGIKHALVSAGGDTGLLGDRRGRPWYVGIKHPRAEEKTAVKLPLSNESISTSGDYERYFIEDGVRYHHIINPKTGDSARKVVSVSIIGKDSTYVDALSTTVFVKGLQEGMAFIEQLPEYEAIIIDNQQTLHVSKGLQQE
jgi:thiamine biosynthesis lipoprotein